MSVDIQRFKDEVMNDLRKRVKTILYDRRLPGIEKRVFCKARVKVVFFVINLGMWKNDKLFRLFMESDRFDPYIVFFPRRSDSPERMRDVQDGLRRHFEAKGFPFIDGYDFSRNEYLDISGLDPDILFYAQPYGVGGEVFNTDRFAGKCLFAYIPYCIPLNDIPKLYNQLYKNICWRMFYPTEYSKEREREHLYTRRDNIVVSGYPSSDYLSETGSPSLGDWKNPGKGYRRIIWAPHHSVLESDVLGYSTFLRIADGMIETAKKYSDRIQFAFKPHPLLREKLSRPEIWGAQRTDEYYALWAQMPNTSLVEGEYYDLFLTSDALIHDCCSFMAEYLYTGKPLMFITSDIGGIAESVNDFGKKCLRRHYHGEGIEDIERFIDSVVINGDDTMLETRRDFYQRSLRTPGTGSVAENIFNVFAEALK